MNKYNRLLSRIASDLDIRKGDTEPESNYKTRLIYSAVSRIGYSSLWDKLEEDIPITIEHFKRRIEKTLSSYLKMYPEVQSLYPEQLDEISDYIYNLLLATGNVYHSPKRISPPANKQAFINGIEFLRGTSLSEKVSISGIGTFSRKNTGNNMISVSEMFDLMPHTIIDYWTHYSEQVKFTVLKTDNRFEFLNTRPAPGNSYWIEKPDINNEKSLMRTSAPGTRIYYFYKYNNKEFEASQIPYWLTDDMNYLYLSNGLLASKKVLPDIKYQIDGAISYLQIGYLLPPAEQNMIMMYSWPKTFLNVKSNFSRVIDTDVLKAIIGLLNQTGFSFKEE
ncbi:hypothetical protein [Ruminococcus flavefaciens]|uniref:hypothetical protein n=1 Tax=Ruminococcus flavefaciens TaxID=1265 RepID=UPI0026EF5BC6|nr:hypothetical protein [Ruminococcus flavefaciens]